MRGYKTIEINNDSRGKSYAIKVTKNQKIIQVHRIASSITFDANYKAIEKLSFAAYTLYMYLLMHSNNRVWALSSKSLYDHSDFTERTYKRAIDELIEKQYLTPGEVDIGTGQVYKNNAFHLWEDPELQNE